MQLQLEFLRRQGILSIDLGNTCIGIYMNSSGNILEDFSKLSNQDLKKFNAVYSFPSLVQGNNIEGVRDLYLYNVGKRLKEHEQLFLNLPGRSSIIPGVVIELRVEKGQSYIKLITQEGSVLFLPYALNKEGGNAASSDGTILSADVIVVVGDGDILRAISNILDSKVVVILSNADVFSQHTGIQDISHKKRISINLSKLLERNTPEIVSFE